MRFVDGSTDEDLALICKGNKEAVSFLRIIVAVLHFWDDLIDRDKELSDDTINLMMWSALVDLPRNTFYGQNFVALNGLLMNAILNWQVATRFEREEANLEIAFIIRSCYIDLATLTALLCGGKAHVEDILPELRVAWHAEGLDGYRKNLTAEAAKRG